MLVAMFNIVNVESVPLNFNFFRWTSIGQQGPKKGRRRSRLITHAGMGSCTEALWYRVPTVAIPQAVDQPGNAPQLEAMRVCGLFATRREACEKADSPSATLRQWPPTFAPASPHCRSSRD